MSDLASLRSILKSELHAESRYIDAAIFTALNRLKSEPLSLNIAKWNFSTEANRFNYKLPSDYVSLRGRVYCSPADTTNSTRYELLPKTLEEVEEYRYGTSDYSSYSTILAEGSPRIYAIDYSGDEIVIAPIPSSGGDNVFFRYTKDLGTPKLSVSITSSTPPSNYSTMTLLSPDGGTLESTFTNAWFTEAFDAVRALAMYNLWSRWHGGTDQSNAKAQLSLVQYLEELNRLRGESATSQAVATIRRYI